MEDGGGFNDRVDKIFGSISSKSSSSLWSLSDAQIERRVWNKSNSNQRDDDQTPLSSSFLNQDEDWDIRSCIGLDTTLDNEDEEDEFDKFAQGKQNHDDRLYMNDVTHHGPYLNSHHLLQPSNHHLHTDKDATMSILKQPPPPSVTSDAITIKSILKRKTDDFTKAPKRVRFDHTCKPNDELPSQGYAALPQPSQETTGRSLPDYILNPSNYTRYDFHHNSLHQDVNERSNKDIYFGFLEKSKNVVGLSDDQSSSAVLPKSVLFIPRKKRGDAAAACNTVKQQQSTGINASGIAALEVQQQEVAEISDMQEQESHVSNKATRQYRTKMEEDDTVC